MSRSSRFKNILNTKEDLWDDSSDTDASSTSDNDQIKNKPSVKISLSSSSDISSDENSEPPRRPACCLVCSVLPNLSDINTCPKHLSLLRTPQTSAQVVYMMHHPTVPCHCRSKRRCRQSSSSSSSSSKPRRRYRKKRSMTIESSDESSPDDLFFSPSVQSQDTTSDDHIQSPPSPSLPPSSTINTNLQQCNELLFLPRPDQRTSIHELKYTPDEFSQTIHERTSPDIVEIDSNEPSATWISLNRIVHVKDEDEIVNDDTNQNDESISMAQATQKMLENEYPQPVIFLERVRFELDY